MKKNRKSVLLTLAVGSLMVFGAILVGHEVAHNLSKSSTLGFENDVSRRFNKMNDAYPYSVSFVLEGQTIYTQGFTEDDSIDYIKVYQATPNVPNKKVYWYSDSNYENNAYIGYFYSENGANQTFYGRYEDADDTNYTYLRYYDNEGNFVNSTQVEYGEVNSYLYMPDYTNSDGQTFTGWVDSSGNRVYDGDVINQTICQDGVYLFATYADTLDNPTLNFYIDDDKIFEAELDMSEGYTYASDFFSALCAHIPNKAGYDFDGFYVTKDSDVEFSIYNEINANTRIPDKIYGRYRESESGSNYKYINFVSENGEYILSSGYTYNDKYESLPVIDEYNYSEHIPEGKVFAGWKDTSGNKVYNSDTFDISLIYDTPYLVADFVDEGALSKIEIELYDDAKYIGTFETDYEAYFGYDDLNERLPNKPGYLFLGWFNEDDEEIDYYLYYSVNDKTDDLVFYAKFEKLEEDDINGASVRIGFIDKENESTSYDSYTIGNPYGFMSSPYNSVDGKIFAGWADADGNVVTVDSKINLTIFLNDWGSETYKANLYAKWVDEDDPEAFVNIILVDGGNITSFKVKKDEYFSLRDYVPEKNGYSFDYATNLLEGGDYYYYLNDEIRFVDNCTAVYYLNYYVSDGDEIEEDSSIHVNFFLDSNDASFYGSVNLNQDEQISLLGIVNPTKEGYTFLGWVDEYGNTIENGTVISNYNNDNNSLSVYASWEVNEEEESELKVDVKVYCLGTVVDTLELTQDSAIGTLPTPSEITGYVFDGWYTSAKGGNEITSDTIFKKASIKGIYAHYSPIEIEARLYSEDGSSYQTVMLTYGGTISSLFEPESRTGYIFNGWFTSDDIMVSNGSVFNYEFEEGNFINLYQSWSQAQSVTFTFMLNDQVYTTSSRLEGEAYGEIPSLDEESLPTGYVFIGWVNDLTGEYLDSSTIVGNENQTYRALLQGIYIDVKVYKNEGDANPTSTTSVQYGYTLNPWYAITKSGYKLLYLVDEEGNHYEYGSTPIEKYDSNKELVLYAVWEEKAKVDIEFYVNGVKLPTVVKAVEGDYCNNYSSQFPEVPSNMIPTGYVFDGWSVDQYVNYGYSYASVGNTGIKLYAIFAGANITVNFYDDDRTTLLGTKETPNGGYINTISNPVKVGYRFVKWVDENGDDYVNGYSFNSPFNSDLVTNVYAVWEEAESITIELMADGSVFDTITVNEGDYISLSNMPHKKGYYVSGWATSQSDADNGNAQYSSNIGCSLYSSTTLYAIFSPIPSRTVYVSVDYGSYSTNGMTSNVGYMSDDNVNESLGVPELREEYKGLYNFVGYNKYGSSQIISDDLCFFEVDESTYILLEAVYEKVKQKYVINEVEVNFAPGVNLLDYISRNIEQPDEYIGGQYATYFTGKWYYYDDNGDVAYLDENSVSSISESYSITVYPEYLSINDASKDIAITLVADEDHSLNGKVIYLSEYYKFFDAYNNLITNDPELGDAYSIYSSFCEGYTLYGIYYDKDFNQPVDYDDIYHQHKVDKIYIKMSRKSILFYVYELNGGSYSDSLTYHGYYGQKFSEIGVSDPVRPGFPFDGWYTDEELTNKIDSDSLVEFTSGQSYIYLYAKWGEPVGDIVKTTFVFTDTVSAEYVGAPGNYCNYSTYTPDGKKFVGFYYDKAFTNECYDYNVFGDEDRVLYARFVNDDECVVSFYLTYESDKPFYSYVAKINSSIEFPTSVTNGDKKLYSWYNKNNTGSVLLKTGTDSSYNLYGTWVDSSQPVAHILTLDYNYDNFIYYADFVADDFINEFIEAPNRYGYKFDGWFYDKECTRPIPESNYYLMPDANITLFAGWSDNSSILTINNYGGAYTYEQLYEVGEVVNRDELDNGYNPDGGFEGWFFDSKFTLPVPESFTMDEGGLNVYAKWNNTPQLMHVVIVLGNGFDDLCFDLAPGTNMYTYLNGAISPQYQNIDGKSIVGWFTDEDFLFYVGNGSSSSGGSTVHYYAKWDAHGTDEWHNGHFVANFYDENGNLLLTQNYTTGDSIRVPDYKVPGYQLTTWYNQNSVLVEDYMNYSFISNIAVYPRGTMPYCCDLQLMVEDGKGGYTNYNRVIFGSNSERPYLPVDMNNPEHKGYHIKYWSFEKNGEPMSINDIDLSHSDQTLVIYGVDAPNKYNVRLESKEVVTPSSIIATFDSPISGLPTPNRSGATFLGWYTSNGVDGVKYENGTVYDLPENTILYARFSNDVVEQEKHTITYKFNNGESDVVISAYKGDSVIHYDESYRRGYTFTGWYEDKDLTNVLAEDLSVMIDRDITVYAKFENVNYIVHFVVEDGAQIVAATNHNARKAAGPISSQDVNVNIDTLLEDVMPSAKKDDYKFLGWFTQEDTSGSLVSGSDTFETLTDDVNQKEITLFAQFAPQSLAESPVIPEEPGEEIETPEVPEVDPVETPEDDITHTTRADIDFKDNISTVKPGEEFTIVITSETTRTGTTWSSADVSIYSEYFGNYVSYVGTTVTLADGTSYNDLNGITFEKGTNPYSYHAAVSFNNLDASTTYSTANVIKFNVTFKLSEIATNIYDTDVGFYTYPSSNKYVYANGTMDTKTAVSTNHTRSNQLVFTVAHDENTITYKPGANGIGEEFSETKIVDQETFDLYDAYFISTTLFERVGYTQVGWTTTDGGELEYALGSMYVANEDLELYPVWEANKYKVSYNTNGGNSIAGANVSFGAAITKPQDPTKKGYIFRGWFKDDETFEEEFDFTSMPANDVTAYAKWAKNILELKSGDPDSYEFITLNVRQENYVVDGTSYTDNYYYRETYLSLGIQHGDEEDGTRVVVGRVKANTSLKAFLSKFKTEQEAIKVVAKDGTVIYENGHVNPELLDGLSEEEFMNDADAYAITTGTKVQLSINGVVYDTIYVSVLADIDCDGDITANDFSVLRDRIKASTVNNYDLEVVLACYVNNDGAYEKFLFSDEYSVVRNAIKNGIEMIDNYQDRNTNVQEQQANNPKARKVTNPVAVTYSIEAETESSKKED